MIKGFSDYAWKKVSASAGASIEIKDFMSTEFDRYEVALDGIRPSSNGDTLELTCSDDNGVTYETGSVYRYGNKGGDITTTTFTSKDVVDNSDAKIVLGSDVHSNNSVRSMSGMLWILNANSRDADYVNLIWQLVEYDGSADPAICYGGGSFITTVPMNAFKLEYVTGNITGTISIRGMK